SGHHAVSLFVTSHHKVALGVDGAAGQARTSTAAHRREFDRARSKGLAIDGEHAGDRNRFESIAFTPAAAAAADQRNDREGCDQSMGEGGRMNSSVHACHPLIESKTPKMI